MDFVEATVLVSEDGVGYKTEHRVSAAAADKAPEKPDRFSRSGSLAQQLLQNKEALEEERKQRNNPFRAPKGLDEDELEFLKEKEMEAWKKEQQAKQEVDKELLLYEAELSKARSSLEDADEILATAPVVEFGRSAAMASAQIAKSPGAAGIPLSTVTAAKPIAVIAKVRAVKHKDGTADDAKEHKKQKKRRKALDGSALLARAKLNDAKAAASKHGTVTSGSSSANGGRTASQGLVNAHTSLHPVSGGPQVGLVSYDSDEDDNS